ncbi:N-6 DNA methylase [uncultured Brachybacterium sp.]|uniref:N-6 DNA methylase n=1 Tax=uncultured Brachybacterium sp. TaxID=189680 RepID=UPI0026199CB6|nr:N-6 DNA methylase [uncultured Brachybacterium sp.]
MSTPSNPTRTLSASDIAQLADVGRSTVSNWRQRYSDFPQPVDGEGTRLRFAAPEVGAWLQKHGKKMKNLDADRMLWSVLDHWRSIAAPEHAGALVADLITWRYVSDPDSAGFDDQLPTSARWLRVKNAEFSAQLAERVEAGMEAYERTHPEWGPLFAALHGDHHGLLVEARRQPRLLESALDAVGHLDVTQLSTVYNAFQDRLTRSARRGYDESASSDTLVTLVATVAQSIPGSVHDPVVGSGRMLMATASRGADRSQLTGQDVQLSACVQATQRAVLAGHTHVNIRQGDVLQHDVFGPGLAQVVVMDPPYGQTAVDTGNLYLDPRLAYGVPPRSRMDLAWPQLAVWYLGAQGRAFVLQAAASAYRGGAEAKIRMSMLQAGTIEAIVALPAGLASRTSIPLNLWVLARPGETSDSDRVLLIDHRGTSDINSEAIATALREWREHRTIPATVPAEARTVAELLAEDANLDPRRGIASNVESPDLQTVRAAVKSLDSVVTSMPRLTTLTASSLVSSERAPKLVSITDLEKAGSLKVLRALETLRADDYGIGGSPAVTGPWIRGLEEPRTIDLSLLEREPVITQVGDVLVQNAGELSARVDIEGGRVLTGSSAYLLRLNGDVLRPDYLAELLVSTQNRNQAQGTAVSRLRLQDVKIPLLPRQHQEQVANRLAEVRALQNSARALVQIADATRQDLVDAITAGTVSVS